MSYILDALRRADAERQRGAVPGLHDQTGPALGGAAAASPAAGPTGRPALLWVVAGAVLVLALGAAWWLGRGAASGGPALAGQPATVPAPVVMAPMAAAPVAAVPVVAVPVAPAPGVQAATVPPPATRAPVAAPGVAAPPVARPASAVPPRAQVPGPLPVPRQPPVVALLPGDRPAPPATLAPMPPARPVPEAASDPVRPWASLPEATRAALPPLAWSGVVYAERAAQRLVVVNGQVAREGDVLGTGLQLLQIGPKSVLLRWQGQRIEMPL